MKKIVAWISALIMLLNFNMPSYCEEVTDGNDGNNVMSALSDTQRNSIGVLNYLSFLTKEIESKKDQKMYLEEAYSSLYNNTYMNSIDAVTLGQVKSLLTALFNFRMLAVKRERMQYIYEQNQAQAIRGAIPSPLNILNIVQAGSWKKSLVAVIFTVVDSISSYTNAKNAAEMAFLQEGWDLADEEAIIIHNGHLDSVDYMWEIIHDYDLPAELAINENDIERFVTWKGNSNVVARIQFLESNQSVYQAFGEYWLVLAESYYEHGDLDKCLEAVNSYELYGTRIFRKDYHYAKVLPMAITAAGEIYDKDRYIAEAERYASRIIANSEQEDWVIRFFAAETYVEIASRSGNRTYLKKAYDIALDNVNYLVQEQIKNNKEYIDEPKQETPANDATAAQKNEIEQYNKGIKAARETALPPLSNALVLNCDMLFSLADELSVSDMEREKIDAILYGNGDVLFLCPEVNNVFSLHPDSDDIDKDIIVSFDKDTIKINARHLTENATVSIGGVDMSTGKIFSIDDWTLQKVERKKTSDLNTFVATYKSNISADYNYTDGSTVWINIDPSGDGHSKTYQISYKANVSTVIFVTTTTFERIE